MTPYIIGGVALAGAGWIVYEFWIAPIYEEFSDGLRPLHFSKSGRTPSHLAAQGSREPIRQRGGVDRRATERPSDKAICPGGLEPHANRIARFYSYSAERLAASDLLFVAAMDRAECLDAELRDMRRHSRGVMVDEFFDECGTDESL